MFYNLTHLKDTNHHIHIAITTVHYNSTSLNNQQNIYTMNPGMRLKKIRNHMV